MKFLLTILTVFFLAGCAVTPVGAQLTPGEGTGLPTYQPLVPDIPLLPTFNGDIPAFINAIFGIVIAVAALLAVLMIAIGGFQIMTSESPFKTGDGKDKIQSAILGLAVVLSSILILRTISPNLVSLDIFRVAQQEVDRRAGNTLNTQQAQLNTQQTTANMTCTNPADASTCTAPTIQNAQLISCDQTTRVCTFQATI